jgi:hypothetical protein
MNRSLHYLITVIALLSFSVLCFSTISDPSNTLKKNCELENTQLDCLIGYSGNRINKNTDVKYDKN